VTNGDILSLLQCDEWLLSEWVATRRYGRRQPYARTHLRSHYSITINNRAANHFLRHYFPGYTTWEHFSVERINTCFNAVTRDLLFSRHVCHLRCNNGCRRHHHHRRRGFSLREIHTSVDSIIIAAHFLLDIFILVRTDFAAGFFPQSEAS